MHDGYTKFISQQPQRTRISTLQQNKVKTHEDHNSVICTWNLVRKCAEGAPKMQWRWQRQFQKVYEGKIEEQVPQTLSQIVHRWFAWRPSTSPPIRHPTPPPLARTFPQRTKWCNTGAKGNVSSGTLSTLGERQWQRKVVKTSHNSLVFSGYAGVHLVECVLLHAVY